VALNDESFERISFQNRDLTLRAVAAGPENGPVVLLLHGFPEFWYGWQKQIRPLADAGFRVIAPDQRGYNESSKPGRVSEYSMPHLVADVLCIIEQLGRERIFLVGHDWGALVAWSVAGAHPDKIERLVIINVPHPAVMPRFLLTRPRQLLRSWYMVFFQIPRLPERLFSADGYKGGERSLIKTSRPGTFSPEDLVQYRKAWGQPGALKAMLNWYRALLRNPSAFRTKIVQVPTLILWGKKDTFLLPGLAPASLRKCQNGKLLWFEDATHWVHHEEPVAVNAAIVKFLQS
jgi:pimeloyl-ACP methyl ester carboxylesterase